ncbi:MAG: hypothetical protein KME14_01940 [Tildeniella torsiva UHER 1998/13D]|jgi:hypothetical protein|nr:hypothetical protein [Tildeniella torsiva UHER 1998/13D]
MTSFSLDTAKTARAYPSTPSPIRPLTRPLRNRWSYGRGYAVIALIAPLLLGSLLVVYLQNTAKMRFTLWRM